MEGCREISDHLVSNIKEVISGKDEKIKLVLCTWIAGGHLLIEGRTRNGKNYFGASSSKVRSN